MPPFIFIEMSLKITVRFFILLIAFALLSNGCKKDKEKENPPGVVSYKIKVVTGTETYINYKYDPVSGNLNRIYGVDRGKSFNCDFTYLGNKVFARYENYTAAEIFNIELEVNLSNGFITRYKDELFDIVFNYDTLSADKRGNLLSSVIVGGRWAGDTLFKNPVYNDKGLLLSCDIYRVATDYKRKMAYTYFTDTEYEAVINTNFVDMAVGRFDKLLGYLPYTFGPPQYYLVKRESIVGYTQFEYDYEKEASGRVKIMYIDRETNEFFYNN